MLALRFVPGALRITVSDQQHDMGGSLTGRWPAATQKVVMSLRKPEWSNGGCLISSAAAPQDHDLQL
jgi:hypothetical protein